MTEGARGVAGGSGWNQGGSIVVDNVVVVGSVDVAVGS